MQQVSLESKFSKLILFLRKQLKTDTVVGRLSHGASSLCQELGATAVQGLRDHTQNAQSSWLSTFLHAGLAILTRPARLHRQLRPATESATERPPSVTRARGPFWHGRTVAFSASLNWECTTTPFCGRAVRLPARGVHSVHG
jgi:hypothetical protein